MKNFIIFSFVQLLLFLPLNTSHAQMMGPGREGMPCYGEGPCMMMDEGRYPMMMRNYGQGMMGQGPHMEWRREEDCSSWFSIIDDLNLSETQLEKINAIRHSYSKEEVMLRAKLKIAQMEFYELMNDDKSDLKGIENKIKEISSLKEELLLNSSRTSISARKVLSADQRKQAVVLMKKRNTQCPYPGGPHMMKWGWHETE